MFGKRKQDEQGNSASILDRLKVEFSIPQTRADPPMPPIEHLLNKNIPQSTANPPMPGTETLDD